MQPEWFIAEASAASAIIALALALGLKEWVFRPKVMPLRSRPDPDESSDCIISERIGTGETAAFIRLYINNNGRSTARNVRVRILQVHRWDSGMKRWMHARPELDGRLLQPSNQLPSTRGPDTIDVVPNSDQIVDLVSVSKAQPMLRVEIGHPLPPNRANELEPGTWKLTLLVGGDNINAKRYFLTATFDGQWPEPEHGKIWDHFHVDDLRS